MAFKNLKTVAAQVVLDSRLCVNPFGITNNDGKLFAAIVGRGNREKWVNFLTKNEFDDSFNRKQREARVTAMLTGVKNRAAATAGARQLPNQTEGQVIRQVAKDIAGTYLDPDKLKEKELKKKVGAAELLFLGGENLDDESGGPLDFTSFDERLAVLCFEKDPDTGEDVLCTNEYLLNPDGSVMVDEEETKKAQEAADREAAELGEESKPVEPVLKLNPWRYWFMGDAILGWMEWESDRIELYYKAQKENLLGNFPPSPAGSRVTGSDENPTSATL